MTARYIVQPVPYGLTYSPDLNAKWSVVDTKPEPESFLTATGAEMTETKAPPIRTVAWCAKQGHAERIADALNHECDETVEAATLAAALAS